MNLPMSLMVFEETQSTMLSAIIMICGVLPDAFLSVMVAPLIDKGKKKQWVIIMDGLMILLYISMGIWMANNEFQYIVYVVFSFVLGTISVFCRMAYSAWYPELIPVGFEQKGYAISGTLYPLITIIMSPVATFLYEKISMSNLFFIVAFTSFLSILLEWQLQEKKKNTISGYTLNQYKEDVKEGFQFLKKEKGIRNIYTYMAITNGVAEGSNIAIQAFYQTSTVLSVTMLGFLKSVEMAGRVLSGFFQYRFEVPPKKRFALTKTVYITYQLADIILLFTPYPAMLVNRFICGGLGNTSATIRETAVQSYLPENMRARVNALFGAFFSIGGIFFQILAGLLGEIISYRAVVVLMGSLTLVAIWILIIRPDEDNRKVYEAVRQK